MARNDNGATHRDRVATDPNLKDAERLMIEALTLLDKSGLQSDAGAHLDLAIQRLRTCISGPKDHQLH